MNFSCVWHELQNDPAWHKHMECLRHARKAVDENNKLRASVLTKYERDLIDYNITQLDEAINTCNDYYTRFLAQHEKN